MNSTMMTMMTMVLKLGNVDNDKIGVELDKMVDYYLNQIMMMTKVTTKKDNLTPLHGSDDDNNDDDDDDEDDAQGDVFWPPGR